MQPMEDANILQVIETGAILGESPVWSVDEQVLYWIDIKAPALHRYDPATGRDEAWPVSQEIGSIVLRKGGGLVGGLRDGFAYLTPGVDRLEWIANPEPDHPESRLNDGRADRQGRFWAGSMHDPEGPPESYFEREPVGAFYRLDGDGSIHRMIDGVLVSNGLCWSPDGTRMYAADSPTRTIRTWNYDPETGDISHEEVFARLPDEPGRGTPDGAIVDAEGGLWVAEFRGSRITRFNPDGTEDRMVALPVSRPTCPMFGGPDLRTLYVTSAKIMLSTDELAREPLAGALFALDVGVAGLPEAAFPG
ncbi:MAG: SMP-30/gluconolactonase/LRE family protein [Alphaproteobacteria bacterium]|nr:SMP-30/gluconolactonase/LRE family protein [Alphaproteobacteria bacterium]